jgi:hypothetical protein
MPLTQKFITTNIEFSVRGEGSLAAPSADVGVYDQEISTGVAAARKAGVPEIVAIFNMN